MSNRDRVPSKTAVAKAIYGLITVLAVLVVLDDHPPSAWRAGTTLHRSRLRQVLSGPGLVAIGGLVVGIKAAFH